VTEPVAVKGETVAENVTGCPVIDGFALDVRVTVVVRFVTVCVRVAEELP